MAKGISAAIRAEVIRRIEAAIQDTAETARDMAVEQAPVRKVIRGARYSRQRRLTVGEQRAQKMVAARLNASLPIASNEELKKKLFTPSQFTTLERRTTGGQPRRIPSNPLLRGTNRRSPANAFFPELPKSTLQGIQDAIGHYEPPETESLRRVKIVRGRAVLAEAARLGGADAAEQLLLSARGRYELKSGRALFKVGGRFYLGGRLRGEIKLGSPTPVISGSEIHQTVESPTPYARYVEFGTRRSRAQPYMRPALAKVRERFAANIRREVLRNKIRTVGS